MSGSLLKGRHRVKGIETPFTTRSSDLNTTDEHAASVTCAEYALAGGWVDELPTVLDALGLRGAPA